MNVHMSAENSKKENLNIQTEQSLQLLNNDDKTTLLHSYGIYLYRHEKYFICYHLILILP